MKNVIECHLLPWPVQQRVHVVLSIPFVDDMLVWKPFLLTFMSLATLNFRWTSALLDLITLTQRVHTSVSPDTNSVSCMPAFYIEFCQELFVHSCRPPHTFAWLPAYGGGPLRLEDVALQNSISSPSRLFFSPGPYPTTSFQVRPEQAQVCPPEGQGCGHVF